MKFPKNNLKNLIALFVCGTFKETSDLMKLLQNIKDYQNDQAFLQIYKIQKITEFPKN